MECNAHLVAVRRRRCRYDRRTRIGTLLALRACATWSSDRTAFCQKRHFWFLAHFLAPDLLTVRRSNQRSSITDA